MIESAEEFVRLRGSLDEAEHHRAAHEPAEVAVWLDLIERFPDYRMWVAHNKTVPPEVLRRLATDPDAGVRSMVAMRRSCPQDVLRQLAADHDESVRARVAWNPKVATDVLRDLANDTSEIVADVARQRLAGG